MQDAAVATTTAVAAGSVYQIRAALSLASACLQALIRQRVNRQPARAGRLPS